MLPSKENHLHFLTLIFGCNTIYALYIDIYTCNARILIFIFKGPVRMSVSQINYTGRVLFLDETAKTEVFCQINCVTITARIGAQRLRSLSPAMVTSSYKCNILAGFKENN